MSASFGWLGSSDTSGDWMSSNGTYVGSPQRSAYWLGQLDTSGDWMSSNGTYFGFVNFTPNPPFPPSSTPYLFAGYLGLTWLFNVMVLTRDWWPNDLLTPYSGQIFPAPNSAGVAQGQIYPY
jgi:hypothetical protein